MCFFRYVTAKGASVRATLSRYGAVVGHATATAGSAGVQLTLRAPKTKTTHRYRLTISVRRPGHAAVTTLRYVTA